jgi:hypothetical protein
MGTFEYRFTRDYEMSDWGVTWAAGDVVVDADFPEPDIPANLVGRGILEYVDQEQEAARLADAE